MGKEVTLRIEVVLAGQYEQHLLVVDVPPGATVFDAIAASDLGDLAGDPSTLGNRVGIFGQRCSLERPVCSGDRVEVYRALVDDPRTIRRRRAAIASSETAT